ncbi:hypothetical protein HYG86_01405 [Alkalicella caledoniensis]|uniref:Uncharacterized protein n=1 Tax=Alkalicella caledoniensis TaxID=2731377 RepID=A0A7G9W4A4_ALKCA|nr:hypothetical protein [Alkalicella caledoniensis]QNO13516.1 hypothetical protein HYG86_01405 [Alkalicella caledoniensis]
MNLNEFLDRLNRSEIEELATNLEVGIFNDCVRGFLVRRIKEKLTCKETLRKKTEVLTEPCLKALNQLVYFNKVENQEQLDGLRETGLIYKDKEIPIEIKELIKEILYFKIHTKDYNYIEGSQTPFLNLIILINLLLEEKAYVRKAKKKTIEIKFYNEALSIDTYMRTLEFLELLVKFLLDKGFAQWKDKDLAVDKFKLLEWSSKETVTRLETFYQSILYKNKKVSDMLTSLSKVQQNPEDWISNDVFLNSDIPNSRDMVEKIGLISFSRTKNGHYMRLTPEGWCYLNGEYPKYWHEKKVLISADFEVFIPNNFDPSLIDLVDSYGDMKKNDYLLVYDIDPNDRKEKIASHNPDKFKKLIEELEAKSTFMPQVVGYEFKKRLLREYAGRETLKNHVFKDGT